MNEPIIKDEKLREAIKVLSYHCEKTDCENCVFYDGKYGEIGSDCIFHKEFPNELSWMIR